MPVRQHLGCESSASQVGLVVSLVVLVVLFPLIVVIT
jgi:hypothetical protein